MTFKDGVFRKSLIFLVLIIFAASATSLGKHRKHEDKAKPELPANHLPVPITPQATNYSCGPAALLAVTVYWKVYEGPESDMYKPMNTTPKDGTKPEKISEFAQKLGLKSQIFRNMKIEDLRAALGKKYTVILNIQAWPNANPHPPWEDLWDDGHYVVLIAIDNDFAYFMDPSLSRGYGYIPLAELTSRWHDFEDRIVRNYQLGIVIKGKRGMDVFPDALERIE
ncbi:MAG: hypothetical protein A2583_11545 [Bdellovibrionales bacterium RIFOXYD1_FULL_53_11]|nr:MAG: hypothetical protein A2583_11545 [Bdellovibrionales bacterium RIFOXYD1_FULL_53_11]